jgi:glycosyltransferase involved in cell wall biosynthesis
VAGGDTRERTALIVTVLNEADTIDALLESISKQRCQPDEVVVVDGGSTDGTSERLAVWTGALPLRVVEAPGANIARGRNLGIAATSCGLIAVTDAGVRLDPDWLANLLACCGDADVVSGFFVGDPHTTFERAMAATVLPSLDDVRADTFLPSSRSILFRRSAWQAVGGYPEWLDYCEDLVFDLALRRSGRRFAFAPTAIARFRPRGSLRSFFRQYFLYARGDGKADLWRKRHAVRYATYLALPFLLRYLKVGGLLLTVGGLAYVRRPLQRLRTRLAGLSAGEAAYAVILVPLIRLVGDVAKMLGYPVGVWWRLRK